MLFRSHPDTASLDNCAAVYAWADFVKHLEVLDSLVKEGGFLCLFNSNYRLEDTPLANRYTRLFPFAADTKPSPCLAHDSYRKLHRLLIGQREEMQLMRSLLESKIPAPILMAEEVGQIASAGVISPSLVKRYEQASLSERLGYVRLFDNQSQALPFPEHGTIFVKLST